MRSWGRNSWVVEAVSLGEDVPSGLAWNQPQFCFDFASKWPRFSPQEDPRSGHDWATIEVLVSRRSFSDQLEAISSRKLPDRGSIAPRSRFDRTAIVEFFHEASKPSDGLHLDERSGFTDPVRRDHDASPPPAIRS